MLVAVVAPYSDANAENDLCVYRAQYGLAPCTTADKCFQQVAETGTDPPEDLTWSLNTSSQLDMISATCPNCRVLLVQTASASIADIGWGVDQAVQLGAGVVTVGVAQPENSADTSADSSYFDHPGVVITAAAGGNGDGVGYPAASPGVVAVGGTTLIPATLTPATCSGSSRCWTETVWNDSADDPPGGATGSGCSQYEPKPSWQQDTGCARRTDNDLSADADPNTGVAVYDSDGEGGWQGGSGIGGTTVAAAIIAGAYALDGPSSGSPAAYPYQYGHPVSINDVTSGDDLPSGGTCPWSSAYLCTAGPGYDGPSGLGTPAGPLALSSHDGLPGVIHSAKFGLCLDNQDGTLADSNPVDINTCAGGFDSQQWIGEPDGTIHLLSSKGTPLTWCLDVYHSGTADSTKVDIYNCNGSGSEQWVAEADGNYINPESGRCLDDPNGSTTVGTQLEIRSCGNFASQEWALPYTRPASQGDITAQDTQLCLDNFESRLKDRNTIDTHACDDDVPDSQASQDWIVEADGSIRLQNTWCLDVAYSGNTAGSPVDLFNCNGSDSQQWRQLSDGALLNPESGLCLADSATPGAQLELQTCDQAPDQSWTLPAPPVI